LKKISGWVAFQLGTDRARAGFHAYCVTLDARTSLLL
jgi:hypothetical protein